MPDTATLLDVRVRDVLKDSPQFLGEILLGVAVVVVWDANTPACLGSRHYSRASRQSPVLDPGPVRLVGAGTLTYSE